MQSESAPLAIDNAFGMLMLYKLLQSLNNDGVTLSILVPNENPAPLLMMLQSPMSFVNSMLTIHYYCLHYASLHNAIYSACASIKEH